MCFQRARALSGSVDAGGERAVVVVAGLGWRVGGLRCAVGWRRGGRGGEGGGGGDARVVVGSEVGEQGAVL